MQHTREAGIEEFMNDESSLWFFSFIFSGYLVIRNDLNN